MRIQLCANPGCQVAGATERKGAPRILRWPPDFSEICTLPMLSTYKAQADFEATGPKDFMCSVPVFRQTLNLIVNLASFTSRFIFHYLTACIPGVRMIHIPNEEFIYKNLFTIQTSGLHHYKGVLSNYFYNITYLNAYWRGLLWWHDK